jgi:hypothetical protein
MLLKDLKSLFSTLKLSVYSLTISNDFSVYSFLILNFIISNDLYSNIVNNFRRLLIKREYSISIKEILYYFYSRKCCKNFGYWLDFDWLSKKECTVYKFIFPTFFLNFKIIEPKNFHLWSFLLSFLLIIDFLLIKKILIIDFLGSFDIFNNSVWHFKFIISIKIKKLNMDYLSIFTKKNLLFDHEPKFGFLEKIFKGTNFLNGSSLFLNNITEFFFL